MRKDKWTRFLFPAMPLLHPIAGLFRASSTFPPSHITPAVPSLLSGWQKSSHPSRLLSNPAHSVSRVNLTLLVRFFNFIYFIYFWLHWVFVAARGLSLVAASRGYSSLQCVGFSLRWLLLLQSTGSRRTGFSSCGTRAQ